ncbi:MAG: site-specific integrase [Bacteroides sp.]|nr:site-specific integrase [Bacteroides sp.]
MEEEEQKIKNPFRKFKFHFDESDRHFLSQEQIEALMTRKFQSEQLQRVRDLFIFSCFTGLSFAEMRNLAEDDIIKSFDGSLWIKDKRQKTKSEYRVRLMKVPSLILEKYAGTGKNGALLPMYCNKVMNEVLHQIGQICEIEQDITFHVGRHSFATLCLTIDVPLETVSKMLGHKSIKTTQIYAQVIDKKLSKDMESMENNINDLAISSQYNINL